MRDTPFAKIKVHATVIFSILNSFSRRSQRNSRVIGTLLGEVNEADGSVTVRALKEKKREEGEKKKERRRKREEEYERKERRRRRREKEKREKGKK